MAGPGNAAVAAAKLPPRGLASRIKCSGLTSVSALGTQAHVAHGRLPATPQCEPSTSTQGGVFYALSLSKIALIWVDRARASTA